jgi:uncharacterized protein YbjT (DUF2867 family)
VRIAVIGVTGQVGARLEERARALGVEVRGVARARGFDLTEVPPHPSGPDPLVAALLGCEAVVDVLQSPDLDERAAVRFFGTTTRRLAGAADRAGVGRRILLSIIGVDRAAGPGSDRAPATTEGYYRAKHEQERIFQALNANGSILRSAQFHDFTREVLGRYGDAVVAKVTDMPVQSVELSYVVDVLLDLAAGRRTQGLLEVAGPRPERLVDLARQFAAVSAPGLRIEPARASGALAAGLLLPGPTALVGGRRFRDWLVDEAGRA